MIGLQHSGADQLSLHIKIRLNHGLALKVAPLGSPWVVQGPLPHKGRAACRIPGHDLRRRISLSLRAGRGLPGSARAAACCAFAAVSARRSCCICLSRWQVLLYGRLPPLLQLVLEPGDNGAFAGGVPFRLFRWFWLDLCSFNSNGCVRL